MMKRILALFLLLVLMSVPAHWAFAYQEEGGQIIRSGEVIKDDLALFGENLVVEAGALVEGDVMVWDGDVQLAGTIVGDVAIMGGNVTLEGNISGNVAVLGGSLDVTSAAMLSGDCVVVGGTLQIDATSTVSCTKPDQVPIAPLNNIAPIIPIQPNPPEAPLPEIEGENGFWGSMMGLLGRTLLLGGIAWLVASAMPQQLGRVRSAIGQRPVASGVVGVLTVGAVASLATILALVSALLTLVCIGLLGFPLLLFMMLFFLGAVILGWVAVGSLLGDRLAQRFNWKRDDLVRATVWGTVVLTFGLGLLGIMPALFAIIAGFVTFVIAGIGLGAAVLTQMGRKPYPEAIDPQKLNDTLSTLPQ